MSLKLVLGMVGVLLSPGEGPPPTRVAPVTDVYHGAEVRDDYRWLESGADPEVRRWTEAQNAYTRSALDSLAGRDAVRDQVTAIMSHSVSSYSELAVRGDRLFAMKRQPPKEQPFLVVMEIAKGPSAEQIVCDPLVLDAGGTTAIDWFEVSPNGELVAVSLSRGGSEAGDVHVFETDTGKQVFEVVPRVNTGTAGGDLAWAPDGTGFFYTRHPRPGERDDADLNFFQQAFFHQLGSSSETDRYELGRDFPRVAEIEFEMHESGQLLLTVQLGDGGQFAHYLRSPNGEWRQFSHFEDTLIQATSGSADYLFALSREGAPRGQIIRIDTESLDVQAAEVVVPQSDASVVNSFYRAAPSILATPQRLYVLCQLGGPSEIRVFDHSGRRMPGPEQPPISSCGGLTPAGDETIYFSTESWVTPHSIHRFDGTTGQTTPSGLSSPREADLSSVIVKREFATSRDGTQVPVNLLIPPSASGPGSHPCVLYGYGGYAISQTPRYRPELKVLLDAGVIYAVANIRGGSEYGEEWHRQGMLTRKQNVFDDFAAAAGYLIEQEYTSPEQLAIMGGSNGGLLMGATLTQHPDLVRCVVAYVGIYDMLRVELSSNGVFNIPEFGTVTSPEHFKAMLAYSPFHNVRSGVAYPSALFLTGENDPRVDPMQSRKMTARLQAATSSDHPVLLRTSADAGHGADTPLTERIAQTVDVYSFLLSELGCPPKAGP